MQNKKLKFVAFLAMVVFLLSTVCYAVDDISDSLLSTSLEDSENENEDQYTINDDLAEGEDDEFDVDETEETESDEDSMVEKDYFYLGGDDLVLDKTIDSNAFIIADEVTISGEIGGDLFVMANSVNLDGGFVYGNVFVLAKDLTLNATVYDIYAACNNLTIEYDGVIYRDLRAVATNISISGGIGRNCYISSNNIEIKEDALIYGNLEYTSSNEVVVPENVVSKEIIPHQVSEDEDTVSELEDNIFVKGLTKIITSIVTTLAILGLIVLTAPKFYSKMSEIKISKIFIGLGFGFAALIGIPIVFFILLFTKVGLSLAFALLTLYLSVLFISSAITNIAVALFIANKSGNLSKGKAFIFSLITAAVFSLISLIPFIGGLISFLAGIAGVGILFVVAIARTKTVTAE